MFLFEIQLFWGHFDFSELSHARGSHESQRMGLNSLLRQGPITQLDLYNSES